MKLLDAAKIAVATRLNLAGTYFGFEELIALELSTTEALSRSACRSRATADCHTIARLPKL